MRIANLTGRLCLITGGGAVDVHAASDGRFDAGPAAVYPRWPEFTAWAASADAARAGRSSAPTRLGLTVARPAPGVRHRPELPRPRRRVGLRAARTAPRRCSPSSRRASPAGYGQIDTAAGRPHRLGGRARRRSSARTAHQVAAAAAWSHVAGLSVGQDISERISQLAGPARRSSAWASRSPASARSGRGWSPPTSSTTRTTWSWAARSTASRCRRAAPASLIFSVPS